MNKTAMGIRVWFVLVSGLAVAGCQSANVSDPVVRSSSYGFKYIDSSGQIAFLSTEQEVDPELKVARRMSRSLDSEIDYDQRLELLDINGDGRAEVLVHFVPAHRRAFDVLEVIEVGGAQFSELLTVLGEVRSGGILQSDLDGDGVLEFYGSRWGAFGDLWVWDEGQYRNIAFERYESVFFGSSTDGDESAIRAVWQAWLMEQKPAR